MLSAILRKECDFVAIEIDILYIYAQELHWSKSCAFKVTSSFLFHVSFLLVRRPRPSILLQLFKIGYRLGLVQWSDPTLFRDLGLIL